MQIKIAVIGLGYVGLPLAVNFAKKFEVVGFDIDSKRIVDLLNGFDRTHEVSKDELTSRSSLRFSDNEKYLSSCNVFIVTVPTPVDEQNDPDLESLKKATYLVANHLKKDDTVIFESTVYPGLTENVCIPILETISKLKCNVDFSVGYSPERINPGDKQHTFEKITKVVSASNYEALEFISDLYSSVVDAGIFKAASIQVAEAAKVIENTQRDLNIALMNELNIIFNQLGINTDEVLQAAETKWNFLKFKPGLVGGHCIGVDPYYLTHLARNLGLEPRLINQGRQINDEMWSYHLKRALAISQFDSSKDKMLILGLTFKENVPDFRNSQMLRMKEFISKEGYDYYFSDPYANLDAVLREDSRLIYFPSSQSQNIFKNKDIEFKLIIKGVRHREYESLSFVEEYRAAKSLIYEI